VESCAAKPLHGVFDVILSKYNGLIVFNLQIFNLCMLIV
jgi:hypothetical protein